MNIRTIVRSRQGAVRILALCVSLTSTALLSGCADFWKPVTTTTTTTTGSGTNLVYVGKNASSQLAGYAIGAGSLTAVSGSPYSLSSPATALSINPKNTFLYIGTASGIYGYSIATGGALTALSSGAALASGYPVASMDVSPDGNWIAVLSNTLTQGIYVYPLNTSTGLFSTGSETTLVPGNGVPVTGSCSPVAQSIKFSPLESQQATTVVAATFGCGGVATYTFNNSTTSGGVPAYVAYLAPTAATISYNGLAWTTNGTSLFVASGGTDNEILPFTVDTTGGTITAATPAQAVGTNPTAISFSKSQSYLYVTNAGNLTTPGSTVSGYAVSISSGTPTFTALANAPYATNGNSPSAIGYDNSGAYMLVLNQTGPPDLLQYTVDTTSGTAGRLYVTASVSTGLSALTTAVGGTVLVTTH
ncbi:MAG TPA: beta-propeller fold lactonase family protein [Acidobacteriaceae bacterium]